MFDKRKSVALQLRRAIELLVQATPLDEKEILAIADLYEPWAPGVEYASGKIVKFGVDENGDAVLYSVLQRHISAENWPPGDTPSLYKKIGFTNAGVPMWVKPLGASDAYNQGDVVSYNGATWVSGISSNVWAPGVYGWRQK